MSSLGRHLELDSSVQRGADQISDKARFQGEQSNRMGVVGRSRNELFLIE
jgi:hypothetical protein